MKHQPNQSRSDLIGTDGSPATCLGVIPIRIDDHTGASIIREVLVRNHCVVTASLVKCCAAKTQEES
jgi:hypothetical protein